MRIVLIDLLDCFSFLIKAGKHFPFDKASKFATKVNKIAAVGVEYKQIFVVIAGNLVIALIFVG